MIRKSLVLLLAIMLLMTLSLGCAPKEAEEEATQEGVTETKESYKIGAVLSVTGPYSGLGIPEKNTLEIEVEKINAAGGINGYPIELFIEDDGTDETKAVNATTKLIERNKVIAIIGATGTGQSMAMRGDIDKAQIPQVCLAGGNIISGQLDKWVFQIPWPNGIVVARVVEYLKDKGVTKAALLIDSGGFGKDGKKVIEEQFPEAGIEIVADESYNEGDLDTKPQLTKIKGTDAEVVVVWGAGKVPSIIAKNMDELQIDIPLIGSHGIARKEFIEGAGEAANGVIFPAGKILIPESYGEGTEARTLADELIANYEKTYGEKPNGTFPGHAYDGLYVVVNALESLGKTPGEITPEELRDEIEKTSNLVLLGGNFTYSASDHAGTKPSDMIMIEIKDGAWVELK